MHEWMDGHVRSTDEWYDETSSDFPSVNLVWETLEVSRLLVITHDPVRSFRASRQFSNVRDLIAEVCGWPKLHQEPWDGYRSWLLDLLFRYETNDDLY